MRADSGVSSSQMQNARAEKPRTRYGNQDQRMGHDRRGCGETKNKEWYTTAVGGDKPSTREGRSVTGCAGHFLKLTLLIYGLVFAGRQNSKVPKKSSYSWCVWGWRKLYKRTEERKIKEGVVGGLGGGGVTEYLINNFTKA